MADTAALLQDVLARLDTLEQRNTALEQRNTALEHDNLQLRNDNDQVQRTLTHLLESSPIPPPAPAASPALEQLSRRWVLRRGMQVAAASLATGVLLHETTQDASAGESFDYIIVTHATDDFYAIAASGPGPNFPTIDSSSANGVAVRGDGNSGNAAILGFNSGPGPGVRGESASANGAVEGKSNNANGNGVQGTGGRHGVVGASSHASGNGVYGNNTNNVGVLGEGMLGVVGKSSTSNYTAVVGEHTGSVGFGVSGIGKGAGYGVTGRSPGGEGVRGEGRTGVNGISTAVNQSGVSGSSTGSNGNGVNGTGNATDGFGVKGTGAVGVGAYSSTYGYEAVYAVHTGDYGFGVVGVGKGVGAGVFGQNPEGDGLYGEGKFGLRVKSTATGGYGAIIEGGKAQLRLVPNTTAGKPTSGSHSKGELVMDKNAALWVCTVAGTPGTWRKVSTTAT